MNQRDFSLTLLTSEERCFLGGWLFEGSDYPWSGPATRKLDSLGVRLCTEISFLTKAFSYSEPPNKFPPLGQPVSEDIPLPWKDKEAVLRRNEEVGNALKASNWAR